MRDDHAVNRAGRRNGNVIHDSVNRVAYKFETGDEGNIELTICKPLAERRWMIEMHLSAPPSNKRTGVEIFDAPDPQRLPACQAQINSVSAADAGFVPFREDGARCR